MLVEVRYPEVVEVKKHYQDKEGEKRTETCVIRFDLDEVRVGWLVRLLAGLTKEFSTIIKYER